MTVDRVLNLQLTDVHAWATAREALSERMYHQAASQYLGAGEDRGNNLRIGSFVTVLGNLVNLYLVDCLADTVRFNREAVTSSRSRRKIRPLG